VFMWVLMDLIVFYLSILILAFLYMSMRSSDSFRIISENFRLYGQSPRNPEHIVRAKHKQPLMSLQQTNTMNPESL